MMNTPLNDNLQSKEEWSSPKINPIIPRNRKLVKKTPCILSLSIIFYVTLLLAGALGAALAVFGIMIICNGLKN